MMGSVLHSDAKLSAWAHRHLASIQAETHNGYQSVGAGIAVTPNCVVTAEHVVNAAAVWDARGNVVRVKVGAQCADGLVLHSDEATDLALVSLDRPIAEPAVFFLGMQGLLSQQSSEVVALGYPHNSGDRNQFEPARFAPELFEFAELRYGIEVGSGLDQGFSGGPFVLGDHPKMPVVGLTQRGGASGITKLRHATEVVRYIMSQGFQPLAMPAWNMPENAPADPRVDASLWAKALDLPGSILNWNQIPALAGKDAQFMLLPTDSGLPVLMMEMVATRQHFGLDYGGYVMTGVSSFERLDHICANVAKQGLRIPHRNDWESAFRSANQRSPKPWPTGSENAGLGTVPPKGSKGRFGIHMAPLGHWEVVASDKNRYELVAPPLMPGGEVRCIDLHRQLDPKAVVLRFCLDLPLPTVITASQNMQWKGA